ncbi:unnamed protein product [Effrenium voratum]|nr:unnamed protein product [Effrenium voratum]
MVLADGEMGSTQEELQDGPLWEEMKEGFRLFGLDPDTHVHDWVELEPDLGRRPRYFAQLKSFQAPEAQRVCLPHPWAFLVGEAAQLTNPWPGRALNACVKSAQLLSQHLKAVAQAIRAGYPIDESFSRDYGETLTRIQGQEESVHRRQCQAEQKSGWSLSTCLQNAMDASEPGDKAAFRRALKKSHQRLRESGHPEVDLAQTWKRLEGQLSARTLALFRASGSWLFDPPPREEQTETETAKEEPEMDEEKWKEMQAAARGAYNRGVRHLKSKDPIPAARSFRSAAEKGHSKAAYALGVMLLNGQGVKKDERAAAQFMNQAAQSGHVKAMYNLGLMLQHGIGLARDVEKASQWTLRAAEGGHRKALRSGNVKIFGAGPWLDYDPKEMGVERIVKEAECGNTHAQFKLGTMHYEGDHVELDKAKSGYWFMQAAQSGLPEAQYQISRMLFQGDGVETDEKYAFRFLKLAAEQGHPESMHNMGAKLYFGEGVDIDRREAASWFLKAAHKELPQAQNNIGWMLYTGDGVPMNMTEGVNWMEQAAAAGNEEAQQHLLSIRGTMVSGF